MFFSQPKVTIDVMGMSLKQVTVTRTLAWQQNDLMWGAGNGKWKEKKITGKSVRKNEETHTAVMASYRS